MVLVKSWDRFQKETIALYEANPNKTRYSVKFRAVDGKLTLKITDDVATFKHTTSSSITLNRFTALNALLFEKMSATSLVPPPPPAPAPAPEDSTAAATAKGADGAGQPMDGVEGATAAAAATPGSAPAAGGKKKKKGKGKK